jgi:RNA-directed DNA polymerase
MVLKPLISLRSWSQISWTRIEKQVKIYRNNIFLASKSGDTARMRFLQGQVLKSKSVLLWAIRRITLVNQGKRTPGIDRQLYLNHEKRWLLFEHISHRGINYFVPSPVKRIFIPKSNGKLRPLGIPSVIDRVIQYVVVVALEPEWEARFEHGSYGFRPGRSCHDAMIRIYQTLNSKKKTFILEGDIKSCFDTISHSVLLKRLVDFPGYFFIEKWLKAGYMLKDKFFETSEGTPQGGAISPLLSNIALHGMEAALGIRYRNGYVRGSPYTLIRYADDFVVMSPSKELAQKAKETLYVFFGQMGLTLSPEKTSITDARKGFDFLGWTFQFFPDNRKPSKEVTLVFPSRKSVEKVRTKLKTVWRALVGNPIGSKLRSLNSIITGWAHYHRFVDASRVFRSLDHFNFRQAARFARRQHPKKSWNWIVLKYFLPVRPNLRDRWVFFDKNSGCSLATFRSHKIVNFQLNSV